MDFTMYQDADGFARVSLRGDCDLYAAPDLYRDLLKVLEDLPQPIRLDFSGVDYLDSSGVGTIIRLVQRAKQERRKLRFCGIGGTPRKVLRMANILPLLEEDEAV